MADRAIHHGRRWCCYAHEQRRFVGKFQQVTAPVMAKAAEDTAAYIFNQRLAPSVPWRANV